MKIVNYDLNIDRTDVAAYYELRAKTEERKAFVTVALIMFSIFAVLPYIFTRIILDCTGMINESTWMLDMLIIQSLIILTLTLGITTNAYRCGKLFKTLRKNDNLSDIIKYIIELGDDNDVIKVAYILNFHKYLYSYVTDNNKLIIVYDDGGYQTYQSINDYNVLCDSDCQNVTLSVNINGISLIERK